MKILQCKNCKGFRPMPQTWVSIIRCSECNYQQEGNWTIVGSKVEVTVMAHSLLNDPVTLENVDLTKPYPRRPRGFV